MVRNNHPARKYSSRADADRYLLPVPPQEHLLLGLLVTGSLANTTHVSLVLGDPGIVGVSLVTINGAANLRIRGLRS